MNRDAEPGTLRAAQLSRSWGWVMSVKGAGRLAILFSAVACLIWSFGGGRDVLHARGAGSEETRVEYITDPSMNNMNAVSVTVPAKWHFQGVLFQGGQC